MLAVRLYDKQKMAPARLTTRSAVCCQASGGCLRVRFCGGQGLPTPGRKARPPVGKARRNRQRYIVIGDLLRSVTPENPKKREQTVTESVSCNGQALELRLRLVGSNVEISRN